MKKPIHDARETLFKAATCLQIAIHKHPDLECAEWTKTITECTSATKGLETMVEDRVRGGVKGGSANTQAQNKARAENGKKGGRPRKISLH